MILIMKRIQYKKLLSVILGGVMLLGACKENPIQEIEKDTLDANISFAVKPDAGTDFFLYLYYTSDENEPFYQRNPDEVMKRTLSVSDIENGFTLPIEDLDRSGFAYATAFVDMDGDGELSEGDIATCYFEHPLRAVMNGQAKASNVAHREFLTIELDQVYSTVRALDVDFTFPVEPAVGTELTLNLYYSQQEELRFFERVPNVVHKQALTEQYIAEGYKMTFDDLSDAPYLYAIAYVDMNGDGEMSYGDVAVVYNGKTVASVFEGNSTANNIGNENAITMEMGHWYTDADGPVTDIDGNVYTTIVVGDKEWMVENLKVTRYRNGAPINTGLDATAWTVATEGAYAVYPHTSTPTTYPVASEEQMIAEFGLLYNGHAVADSRGLAPIGWRIATDNDFKELEIYAGMPITGTGNVNNEGWRGDATITTKFRSTTVWASPGTNELGFTALPGGARNSSGAYVDFRSRGDFWTSTPNTAGTQLLRRLVSPTQIGRSPSSSRNFGNFVRCVRDI